MIANNLANNFSCTNSERLNDEQKTAIKNIAEGYCRPLPYLLYGPAGVVFKFLLYL